MKKYISDTIEYYDNNYESYNSNWNEEFLKNFNFDIPEIFLGYLKPNSYILDLGCGTGRDSLYFKKNGHKVKCIDGSKEMCKIASRTLNEPVEQMNFLDIDYENTFDAVFACASMLHLNNKDLIDCLKKIDKALKCNGTLYVSFKYGEAERIKDGRYFNDMTKERFKQICDNFKDLKIIKTWKNEQYGSHKQFINFIIKKNN